MESIPLESECAQEILIHQNETDNNEIFLFSDIIIDDICPDDRIVRSVQCTQGHKFDCSLAVFAAGLWCIRCDGAEFAQDKIAEAHGGRCVRYAKHSKDKAIMCCENFFNDGTPHPEWGITINNMKRGTWCHKCADQRKMYSIEELHELARKNGGYCLSNIYLGIQVHHKWQCGDCGHIWSTQPIIIMHQNSWCPKCRKHCHSIEDAQNLAASKGGRCLSPADAYKNWKSVLEWECLFGHIWTTSYSNVCHNGTWCRVCIGNGIHTLASMQQLAIKRGGLFLSKVYTNRHGKYIWDCGHGHTWTTTADTVIGGTWCPTCWMETRESKGAKLIREFLTFNLIKFKQEKKFKECKMVHPLRFDFYVRKQLSDLYDYIQEMLIEQDGETHFHHVEFYADLDKFDRSIVSDMTKTAYCLANNIPLIRIPYDCKNALEYLENIMKTNPRIVMQPLIHNYNGSIQCFRAENPTDRYITFSLDDYHTNKNIVASTNGDNNNNI